MKILSLSGKKQSGKTTIANLISDIILKVNPKAQVHIISWADSLKEEVSKATGYSVAQIEQDLW
jgi:uridine kinase